MLLYLVRHAQSRANADAACREVDCDLTDLGRRQAELVASALSGERFAQALASPYQRTVATAREIARATGTALALFPRAHEHHGLAPAGWTPPTRSELLWRYPDVGLPPETPETGWHAFPETVDQVALRMGGVLEALRGAYGGHDRVLLVSHASPIQQLVGVATGAYTPAEATRIAIGNASLTILDVSVLPAKAEVVGRDEYLRAPEPVAI